MTFAIFLGGFARLLPIGNGTRVTGGEQTIYGVDEPFCWGEKHSPRRFRTICTARGGCLMLSLSFVFRVDLTTFVHTINLENESISGNGGANESLFGPWSRGRNQGEK